MARWGELPELELLPFDDDEDLHGPDASEAVHGRRWPVVALVVALTGALVALLLSGRPDPTVELLPTPVTTVPVPTTTTTVAPRGGPSSVMAAGGGQGIFISSNRWTGTIPIAPELGRVTSVATGRGFIVVALSSGEIRRYDRRGDWMGEAVGHGELVVTDPGDRRVVWAVSTADGRQSLLAIPEEGPPTATQPVPDGWRVVGSTAQGMVLTGSTAATGVALWSTWSVENPVVLDAGGRYLASNRSSVAWWHDGQVIVADDPVQPFTSTVVSGEVASAGFSPDGATLALLGPNEGAAGWAVRFVSRLGRLQDGFVVSGAATPRIGWSSQGELLVDPGTAREHRYDPESGLLTVRPPLIADDG